MIKIFYRWINVNLALKVKKFRLEEFVFANSGILDLVNFLLILVFPKFGYLNLNKFLLIIVFDKSLIFVLVSLLVLVFLLSVVFILELVFNIEMSDIIFT